MAFKMEYFIPNTNNGNNIVIINKNNSVEIYLIIGILDNLNDRKLLKQDVIVYNELIFFKNRRKSYDKKIKNSYYYCINKPHMIIKYKNFWNGMDKNPDNIIYDDILVNNNVFLLETTTNKYTLIFENILIKFKLSNNEKVINFFNMFGNNALSYPVLITNKYLYSYCDYLEKYKLSDNIDEILDIINNKIKSIKDYKKSSNKKYKKIMEEFHYNFICNDNKLSILQNKKSPIYNFHIPYIENEKNINNAGIIPGKLSLIHKNWKLKKYQIIDKNFVFSGLRNNILEYIIEKNGGKVQNKVNNNTHVLIIKDIKKNSSKIKKAKELQIPVYDLKFLIYYLQDLDEVKYRLVNGKTVKIPENQKKYYSLI